MDWIYYVFYVVGGVWLISHWWTRRSLRNLKVSRRAPTKAFAGETVRSDVSFQNRSRLPIPWLRLQENVPIDLRAVDEYSTVISIGGRSLTNRRFSLHCHRRGYYEIGPLNLQTGDMFGFAESSWQETKSHHLTVYPKVYSLAELGLPSLLPFGDMRSPHRLFQDPTRMSGVRPYASGDSMRHIHWRASARENTLLVKKFQPSMALSTTVVLDLDRGAFPYREEYSGSEWAIVLAASVASHVAEQRQEVGFLSNGEDPRSGAEVLEIPSRNGRGHLMGILEILARIQLRDARNAEGGTTGAKGGHPADKPEEGTAGANQVSPNALANWLPARTAHLSWGSTLVVVTPRITEGLIWVLHGMYRRGINVFALACTLQPQFKLMQEQGEALGIVSHQTIWESDLMKLQG
jgi:uncharacterized protein (DUF58 family)